MGGVKAGLVALVTAALVAVPAHAAEWQGEDLEPGSGYADVAIDAAGNAVAVWTPDQGGSPVRVSFRPAGGHFGAPQTLDECGGVHPRVDVDAQGEFTALWVRCDGSVQAATSAGGGFGAPVTIAAAPSGGESHAYPDLDVAPTGAAVAAWQTTSQAEDGEHHARADAALRAPGGSWGPAETISPGPLAPWTLTMSDNIDVGIDSEGSAVVLFRRWLRDDDPWGDPEQMFGFESNYKIDQVVVGRAGDGFEAPRTIDENGELESVRLAVGSGGDTLLSWIVHGTSQAVGVIAGTTADPLAGDPYEAFRSSDQDNGRPVPHIDGTGRAYIVFARHGVALLEAPGVAGPWDGPQRVSADDPPLFDSAVSDAGEIVVATYTDRTAVAHVRLAGGGDFVHSQSYRGYPALATAVNAGRAVAMWTQPERFAAVYDEAAESRAIPADTRAPRCDVERFQRSARRVFSFVTECNEAADLTATLAIRRRRLASSTGRVRADRARTLRLRTARKGRRTLARASSGRRKVFVKLLLTATDAAGNFRVVRRRAAILAGE